MQLEAINEIGKSSLMKRQVEMKRLSSDKRISDVKEQQHTVTRGLSTLVSTSTRLLLLVLLSDLWGLSSQSLTLPARAKEP
ncbi:hypothetical protein CTI12_AA198860 [Artemisia annua]|uniref:Uncharacterized protein n=1 Tax=Artemisia annua TaxID=35608 RepID=A0A2U1P390_ARTAN|nr:hypothetical protein CTI12_AA198860 [Artemisia annua]